MKIYRVVITEKAREDLKELSRVIREEYKSPLTAVRYLRNLSKEIKHLIKSAESYSIQRKKYFNQFGTTVRCIIYKKMTVIYSVIDDTVYVLCVIPSVTIK